MNINPNAKRILCYGDSNVWGIKPGSLGRYPINIRWTGVLQEKLGNNFEIIEEGMTGRTTNLENPRVENANGKIYLAPCLKSHNPIDIVILLLGTNDLKDIFDRIAKDVSRAVGELMNIIKDKAIGLNGLTPEIILLSPTLVGEGVKKLDRILTEDPRNQNILQKSLEKSPISIIANLLI